MTLRRLALVGNFRDIPAFCQAPTSTNTQQSRSISGVTRAEVPQKWLDLPDSFGNVGIKSRNPDSNAQAVPLAFISYEDKSALKDGKQKKSPLIIQHSLIGSKENWKTVSKAIHHVTKRTVYSVDCRNHGDSPHTKTMSYGTMAKDIESFIKQTNAPKVSFLGHSFGGRIGLLLALMRPELFDKLVVVDSSPFVNKKSIQRWSLLREACARLRAIEKELKESSGLARRTLADKTVESILTDKKDRALFLSNLITSEDSKKSDSRIWRVNLEAIFENPKLMSEYPDIFSASCTCKDLSSYRGKVLFVSGDKSQFVRKEDETSIKVLFPNAEFVWFADAGHWMHVERHADFMKTVVPYLEAP